MLSYILISLLQPRTKGGGGGSIYNVVGIYYTYTIGWVYEVWVTCVAKWERHINMKGICSGDVCGSYHLHP